MVHRLTFKNYTRVDFEPLQNVLVRPHRGSCAGAPPTTGDTYIHEATTATATLKAQAFAL